ncbi:hypothetical protein M9H77_10019 [Catharanthus roseus]|uniref:Uncharacterized protein n=1 Tax=Catharanthus roseus TaxID=4058 RepID=A0ACC0C2A1_CATRO|nr:hypothetical protein M9H77_10019 [Catharanthus roseus]
MNSFSLSFTITIILIISSFFLPFSSCDSIQNVCKTTPNPQLCSSILRSNPRSKSADITTLSLIMVDEVKSKVNSALQIISKLEKSNPKQKDALSDCKRRLSVVEKYDVGVAIEALNKGDDKFAVDSMNDASIEAQICEENLKTKKMNNNDYYSSMSKMNKDVQDYSLVAAAIMKLLL